MNDTTFTRGPWRARGSAVVCDTKPQYRVEHQFLIGAETVEESDAKEIKAYGGHLIAESICPENVDLIAAAPDLYAALLDLIRSGQHEGDCDNVGKNGVPCFKHLSAAAGRERRAREALAKARGEAVRV